MTEILRNPQSPNPEHLPHGDLYATEAGRHSAEIIAPAPNMAIPEIEIPINDVTDMATPPVEVLSSPVEAERAGFWHNRWQSIRKLFRNAQENIRAIKEGPGIEGVDGLPLSRGEYLRIGIALRRARRSDNRVGYTDYDREKEITADIRKRNKGRAKKPTTADIAKIAAYEVLTLAPIRMAGVMALRGYLDRGDRGDNEPTSTAQKWARKRAATYERGDHNPTAKKLNGYKQMSSGARRLGRDILR